MTTTLQLTTLGSSSVRIDLDPGNSDAQAA